MKIEEEISKLNEQIHVLECIREFAKTSRIENTRTDATFEEFIDKYGVNIEQKKFTRIICENYNFTSVQTKILNERCYVYESKSLSSASAKI